MNKKYKESGRSTCLQDIRGRAEQRQIPIISLATEQFLVEQVQESCPVDVLEIGTAIGYSTCLLANHIFPWQGHITSFEISAPSYHAALYHRDILQSRNSRIYHRDILNVDLPLLGVGTLDFVFVDGMKIHYAAYLHTIRPWCASGCTIIFDDVVSQKDKMDALWIFLEQEDLSYTINRLSDGDGVVVVTL